MYIDYRYAKSAIVHVPEKSRRKLPFWVIRMLFITQSVSYLGNSAFLPQSPQQRLWAVIVFHADWTCIHFCKLTNAIPEPGKRTLLLSIRVLFHFLFLLLSIFVKTLRHNSLQKPSMSNPKNTAAEMVKSVLSPKKPIKICSFKFHLR